MQKLKIKKSKIVEEIENKQCKHAHEDKMPKVDFKKLKREQSARDTAEFPFTLCHIEDCVFVTKVGEGDHEDIDIIALEVIFY